MRVGKTMRIEVTGGDSTDIDSLMERLRLELLKRARPESQATSPPDISAAPVLDKAADKLTVTMRPEDMHAVLVIVLTEFLRTHADTAIETGRAAIRSDTPFSHTQHILGVVAETSDLEVEYHLARHPHPRVEELDPAWIKLAWIELTWSMSDWIRKETSGLLPWLEAWPLPEPDEFVRPTLPVTIYLSDEHAHDQVEAAVGELLATADLQIEDRDEPVIGSWFRRMRATLKEAIRSPAAREGALVAAHAADTRLILAHDAAITATLLQNLGPVITSLQPTKDAVLRVGALLIVKVDGMVNVFQLTAAQQAVLDHRPQLASSPHEIIAALDLTATREDDNPSALN